MVGLVLKDKVEERDSSRRLSGQERGKRLNLGRGIQDREEGWVPKLFGGEAVKASKTARFPAWWWSGSWGPMGGQA
jgi:hypothetical protein